MRVSLITTVHNVEPYIRECVLSLMEQTYPDIEFLFIDDASTDGSLRILEETVALYPRREVRIIRRETNGGIARVRMQALEEMTGDYFVFSDSDDTVEKDFVEAMVSQAEAQQADIVCCDVVKEYSDGKAKLQKAWKKTPADGRDAALAVLRGDMPGYMCNKLIASPLARGIIAPVDCYQEDMAMMVQIFFRCTRVVRVEKALYHYKRRRSGAITASSWRRKHRASAANMNALYDALPEGPLKETCGADIALRAGWYSLTADGLGGLRNCPQSVLEAIRKAPRIKGCRVSPLAQALLKLACKML